MNTWKQKSQLTQADLTSEPSAKLTQERSPVVRYLQEATAGEQSHPLELDKQMRNRMERQFGLNFSAVRLVESDLPGKLGADAVAQGDLIRFAPGAFHPETAQGEQLLSHELSHVVQQSRGQGMGGVAGMPWVDAGTESGADAMAAQAMSGGLPAEPARSISPVPAASAPMLCCPNGQGKSKLPSGRKSAQKKTKKPYLKPIRQESQNSNVSTSQVVPEKKELQAQPGGQPRIPDHQESQPSYLQQSEYMERAERENRAQFNPHGDSDLANTLTDIDKATDVQKAHAALNRSLTNKISGKIGGMAIGFMNLRSVKLRLKGIARMMSEFPQLDGQIHAFDTVINANENSCMSAFRRPLNDKEKKEKGRERDTVMGWSSFPRSYMHGRSDEIGPNKYSNSDYKRRKSTRDKGRKAGWSIASGRWNGTHELGHVLQFMLDDQLRNSGLGNKTKSICSDPEMQKNYENLLEESRFTASSVVQQAISQLLTDPSLNVFKRIQLRQFVKKYTSKGKGSNEHMLTLEELKERSENLDLLDYSALNQNYNCSDQNFMVQKEKDYKRKLQDLHQMGLTSGYGATGIAEVFAEAFADYFDHGDGANPLSKKIVEIVKGQTAHDSNLTDQQGDWIDKERLKVNTIFQNLPTLKLMSKDERQAKRNAERTEKIRKRWTVQKR